MSLLTDHTWKHKYTPEDGNLLKKFYLPALSCAVRYDRSTGFFAAGALAAASQGVEELLRNNGKMRLLVGCTLDKPEVEAVLRGESLRDTLDAHMLRMPLKSEAGYIVDALELLAWMVAKGHLEVRVAVPCDSQKRPVASKAIFHEKAGIIEDKTGDRLAFNGSINETYFGWTQNWDSFHVFTSWSGSAEHVDAEELSFQKLWANRTATALVVDMPKALREDLLRFLPKEDNLPQRLTSTVNPTLPASPEPAEEESPTPESPRCQLDARAEIWNYIAQAPALPNGGERVGEATCPVIPWPHQVRSFHRMYDHWPPKILIADEVGLGKTIQAGLLLRQAWLSGRAKRILVLAPKAILRQWQIELREKFNLNWPIYDGQKLCWYPSPALRQADSEKTVSRQEWHQEPFVLVSSHLMRRRDRAEELLKSTPWDIIVLDEAHHARRKSGGLSTKDNRPNQILRLMQELKHKTQGLILLTATPMQVSPLEVWDLLHLLGLPPEWDADSFLKFFEHIALPAPSDAQLFNMAELFKAAESMYGLVRQEEARRFAPKESNIATKKILKALRESSSIPLRRLETAERRAAVVLMKAYSPLKRLISRHTRELLRRYHKAGKLQTRIAMRQVEDRLITMTPQERVVYEAVEDYISTTYNHATPEKRNAIGFVMTIYRRRLASSFFALSQTLENRLHRMGQSEPGSLLEEDVLEDAITSDFMDDEEAAKLESLVHEEKLDIQALLEEARRLPVDTKARVLLDVIRELRTDGFEQVMVFTQYTDTLDFLRREVVSRYGAQSVLCFSGRGGEILSSDGNWRLITREETKKRFRERQAEIMLCTDAAAEGLNFQFCGALINYDMPWNPMRVEQRIGRIDRLGQEFENIRIINLHYEDTVETDVYCALRERINLFTNFVGKLQPILARLPRALADVTLIRKEDKQREEEVLISNLAQEARELEASGFDLDDTTQEELTEPVRPQALYDLGYLKQILDDSGLLPPGVQANPISGKDFSYLAPGMVASVRVTTDAEFYDAHPESVELWSPGNPVFPNLVYGRRSGGNNE